MRGSPLQPPAVHQRTVKSHGTETVFRCLEIQLINQRFYIFHRLKEWMYKISFDQGVTGIPSSDYKQTSEYSGPFSLLWPCRASRRILVP